MTFEVADLQAQRAFTRTSRYFCSVAKRAEAGHPGELSSTSTHLLAGPETSYLFAPTPKIGDTYGSFAWRGHVLPVDSSAALKQFWKLANTNLAGVRWVTFQATHCQIRSQPQWAFISSTGDASIVCYQRTGHLVTQWLILYLWTLSGVREIV
jgi:hypothetical protein